MKVTHLRFYFGEKYTVSKIYIDGTYFCDAIEDKDRGLSSNMSESEIGSRKVYAETAIPYGIYDVTIDVVSLKFAKKALYNPIRGKLPRLLGVKGFDGILVHIGNTERDSAGCIIVGINSEVGKVTNSTQTFFKLYARMQAAKAKGEKITWEITAKK